MERVWCNASVLSDIDGTVATTAYCIQRANLIGYHRIFTVWRETQPAQRVKSVIGYWLEVLNEIEGGA
jgi:hypothetical protein